MITARIDVTKIDKSRLFKGEKGTYLDIVLIDTPAAKYGNDFIVKQSISKEEREAGKDAPILGNGKTLKPAEPPQGIYEKTGKIDKPVINEPKDDSMPF
jgi:hypothetical protein